MVSKVEVKHRNRHLTMSGIASIERFEKYITVRQRQQKYVAARNDLLLRFLWLGRRSGTGWNLWQQPRIAFERETSGGLGHATQPANKAKKEAGVTRGQAEG